MQVINSFDIGGAERVAINIAANLDPLMFNSFILTIDGLGPFKSILDNLGIEYKSLNKGPGTKPEIFFKIAKESRMRGVDVITTHNYGALFYGAIGGRLAGIKRILHVDHAREFPGNKRIISEKLLSKITYKVIAVSAELKNNLIQYERIRSDKIDIILNGIDETQFNRDFDKDIKKAELGFKDNKIIIGTCVRLAEEKGLIYLLDAVKLISQKRQDFRVLIAGDGPLRRDLEERAASLQLNNHVVFLGARMDINEIIHLIDIYTLTSVREGLPLSILEAMAARRAIVATTVGGVPDVISNNKNGILVPPRQPIAFADAIEFFMDNPSKRAEFGNRSYVKFMEKYSAKMMAHSYGIYYEQMMRNM
ncbi:MAG: glycosyltransferase [Bacteroidales bacterium]|nr:glycosyltransferase [Bacteroidales bacterium]